MNHLIGTLAAWLDWHGHMKARNVFLQVFGPLSAKAKDSFDAFFTEKGM